MTKTPLTVRLKQAQHRALTRIANHTGISKSDIVRRSLRSYFRAFDRRHGAAALALLFLTGCAGPFAIPYRPDYSRKSYLSIDGQGRMTRHIKNKDYIIRKLASDLSEVNRENRALRVAVQKFELFKSSGPAK